MVPVQPDANSIMKAVVSADFSSECKNYPAEPGSVEGMTRAEQARWLTPVQKGGHLDITQLSAAC